jgi:Na+-translocating ferredoxin:NAD+ oxidoreductase RnfC subunit
MNAHAASLSAIAQSLRERGVVGAGGAGQPLADKLLARTYRTLIINAAQSEPLFSKDWAVLAANAECVFTGARVLRDALGLSKVFLATRDEFASALPELAAAARKHQVALARLPDAYPLGYEKILKREVLGIGIDAPGADEVLVVNAETVRNVAWAAERPVTSKMISLAGLAHEPLSIEVPIGTPFADCLALAGGARQASYVVLENGALGGRPIAPEAAWVSATTLGYLLLPPGHSAAGGAIDARLAQRRAAFFSTTLAGRTQPMSAAYALFDLTAFRRRPIVRALKESGFTVPQVRIAPCGKANAFAPCVAAGERVERGQPIARPLPGTSGVTQHASIAGLVESVASDAIVIRRTVNATHATY